MRSEKRIRWGLSLILTNLFSSIKNFFHIYFSDFLYLLRQWKRLTLRKILYLPHLFSSEERRLFCILGAIIIISAGALASRLYMRITVPAPDIGKSYTEGLLRDPRLINPLFAVNDSERDLSRLMFTGLFTYSEKGILKPDLTDHYEVTEDGKQYTVTLVPHAQWHDGEPLTADDVIFTIKMIQNPAYKSPLRQNWQGVHVEALDRYTVRFTLRTSYTPFIENLTVGILPSHLWKDIPPEQATRNELNTKPVGAGPYVFYSLKYGKDGSIIRYELTRNRHYHREGPYLKQLIFLFFKNEEALKVAWRKGEIEGFGAVSPTLVPELTTKNMTVFSLRTPRIFGVFFNQKKSSLLASKKIRLAIAQTLGKEDFFNHGSNGGFIATHTPFPWRTGILAQSISTHDSNMAKRLLAEDGWKDTNNDGLLEKKNRQKGKEVITPLRLTLTTSDWPDLIKAAERIKDILKGIGVEIIIEKKTLAELETSVIRPRAFEMLLFGQVYGYEPDPFAFWHSSQIKDPGLNIALYTNKQADRILEEARRINDPLRRTEYYEKFSDILLNDIPAVFLFSQLYLYALPTDLQNVKLEKISLPADRFNEINQWYRDTKRVFKW